GLGALGGEEVETEVAVGKEPSKDDKKRKAQDGGNPSKKPKRVVEKTHIYNGRVQKLISVTASYASARLNYYLSQHTWSDLDPKVRDRVLSHVAHYDARVVPCPSNKEAMECIFWRSNYDGMRNAISSISQAHFPPKQLQKKNVREQLDMLLNQKGLNVFAGGFDKKYLYGTWVKKELYELEGAVNPKTGKPVEGKVMRGRLRRGSFNWADWSEEERIAFTMEKYWPEGPRSPPKFPVGVEGSESSAEDKMSTE
ncbi:hypothetical protein HK102_011308, partial [Quaeritorhiza haematococci]